MYRRHSDAKSTASSVEPSPAQAVGWLRPRPASRSSARATSQDRLALRIRKSQNNSASRGNWWRAGAIVAGGLAGIEKDAPRPDRTPAVSAEKVQQIIHKTTREKPANATHWSTRTMAAEAGVSASTVGRIGAPTPQAAPRQELQAQQRPALRRKTRRHRRTLSQPARTCHRSFPRREVTNPSACSRSAARR